MGLGGKWLSLCVAAAVAAAPAIGQVAPQKGPWTAEQDHQDMMDRLGIRKLRPGPSGNDSDPNHANTDERLANPWPVWPDLMKTHDGRAVTTANQWWKLRRPEIVEDLEREVYGRVPKDAPKVTIKMVMRSVAIIRLGIS